MWVQPEACGAGVCSYTGSSGYWHRYKKKSPQTQRGWHQGGLDAGNAGVAIRSSSSHTEGKWKESPKLCPVLLDIQTDLSNMYTAIASSRSILPSHTLCAQHPAPTALHQTPPSPSPAGARTPSPLLLRHADSVHKATYFKPSSRALPPSHVCTTLMFMQYHERRLKKHVGKPPPPPPPPQPLQTSPCSPLPPPLAFQKGLEGVKISPLSSQLGPCTQAISAC